jgi:hypothetical protein
MELETTEAIEAAEHSINVFINKRARDREEANAVEDLWREGERRHKEKLRRENREAWACYHAHMQALHDALAAEHRAKAEALLVAERTA